MPAGYRNADRHQGPMQGLSAASDFGPGAGDFFDRIDIAGQTDSFTSINLVTQRGPPPVIIQVPAYGFGNPRHKCFFGLPPQFRLQLAGVDCIAMVVSWPIRHIRNVSIMVPAARLYLIEYSAFSLYHFQFRALVTSTNVIGLARSPVIPNAMYCLAC